MRLQTQHATADRDAHIASAQKLLATVVDPSRLRRAEIKGREERVQELWDGVNQLRSTNDSRACFTSPPHQFVWLTFFAVRDRIQKLRSNLGTRRRTLANATSTILHAHSSFPSSVRGMWISSSVDLQDSARSQALWSSVKYTSVKYTLTTSTPHLHSSLALDVCVYFVSFGFITFIS